MTAETNRATDEESRIEGLVTAETNRAQGEESRLEGLITDNKDSIDALAGVVETNKSAAERAATSLSGRITKLETDGATSEGLNAVNELVGANTSAIATLGDRVTQLDENTSSKFDAIDDRIDLLNGTVTTQGNTLSNKADTSTVTTLETKVDNNKKAADDALATKADKTTVEALQTTVSGKADAATVTELAGTVSSKANQSELNTLSELVNTKASTDALGEANAKIAALEAQNEELRGLIEALTARVDALENPVTE